MTAVGRMVDIRPQTVRALKERLSRPLTSPPIRPQKLSQHTLTLQVTGHLEDSPFFCHEYLKRT